MQDLNLRQIVRDVCDQTDLADPGEVADKVLADLDPAGYGEALRQALRPFVRLVMHSITDPVQETPLPKSSRSAKVAGIREAWQLRRYVNTADGYKRLRECTRDDLLFAAKERRQKAAENLAAAERYEQVADLLKRHKAATVGELPLSEVVELIGADA